MVDNKLETDDPLQMILGDLSKESFQKQLNIESDDRKEIIPPNREELEQYIIKSGAETVSTTQDIINVLLQQIRITPDPELITSVAEMINSKAKAVENLTKVFLSNEKLKQAKEIEQYKQSTKLQIASNQTRPAITHEEVMKLLNDEISPVINTIKPVKKKKKNNSKILKN